MLPLALNSKYVDHLFFNREDFVSKATECVTELALSIRSMPSRIFSGPGCPAALNNAVFSEEWTIRKTCS